MERATSNLVLLILKLIVLILFLSPFLGTAMALDEFTADYDAPQALGMGNAQTADARGYLANYYNPAGLAKELSHRWHWDIVGVDGIPSGSGLATVVEGRTLGMYHLFDEVQGRPGDHTYFRFNFTSALTRRNFALNLLGSYYFAARSDGTQVDVNAGTDYGPTLGFATNLAGNMIKIGASVGAVIRNELRGVYNHSQLSSPDAIRALMREGYGFPVHVGFMLTLPNSWLPTLGLVWKNALDTRFTASNIINSASTAAPDTIPQSFHVGVSVHPKFNWHFKTTISAEVKHLERSDVPFRKRFHLGVELEDRRSLYFWGGLNQFYLTAGVGLRVKGGNLEVGTYGQDVGINPDSEESRRVFFRYTIGF